MSSAENMRAPPAPVVVTDDLVACGVAGIERRDAEGWSDEDEDQINRELARAVLVAVLTPPETTSEVIRRLVPTGHACGPVIVDEADFSDLEAAIAHEKAVRASEMPTELDALAQLNGAYRRLQDLGWREAQYCPKDGSEFDVVEAGSTAIHPCIYMGDWPKGSYLIASDGDLWPSHPILFRVKAAQP